MSSDSALTAYFFVEPLKSRFAANLERVLREQRIADLEYQLLKKLLVADDAEVPAGSGLRVDRLIVEDGSLIPDELATALVFSPVGSADTWVYLDTLHQGLERFPNRTALLRALENYTVSATKPAYECQVIEGDLFEQRMLLIIDHQVERLRGLAARLQHVPSLDAALNAALRQHAGPPLPEAASDLSLPWVQVFGVDQANPALSVRHQTLVEAAGDVLTGQQLPVSRRSYLRTNGQIIDATQSKRYDQWLVDAVSGLAPVYKSLLHDYWQYANASGQTPRTLAAFALAAQFRQALLRGQHTGHLRDGEGTLMSGLLDREPRKSSIVCKRMSLLINDRQPLQLAGLILIEGHPLQDLFVYSAQQGIRRFATSQAMDAHYATEAGRRELQLHLSLDQHSLPGLGAALQIEAQVIEQTPSIDLIDSIIGLQKRNLGFVLTGGFTDVASAAAKLDDALDVRCLIDSRLASFDGGGRWLQRPGSFTQLWLPVTAPTSPGDSRPGMTWTQRIAELEAKIQWLNGTHTGIGESARHMLNEYLAIFCEPSLDAIDLRVRLPEAAQGDAQNSLNRQASEPEELLRTLIDLLLEKFTGYRAQNIPLTAPIVRALPGLAQPEPLPMLTPGLINPILDRVCSGLEAAFLKRVRERYDRPLRSVSEQIIPADIAMGFLSDVLRLECDLQGRLQKFPSSALQMLEQVLNYPVRSMRVPQGDGLVEVYSLYLEIDHDQAPALLSELFILYRPAHSHEHVLCWSALAGVEVFDSIAALRRRLHRRLSSAASRERWLGLLSEPHRSQIRACLEQPGRSPLGLQFNRIDDDIVQVLLQIDRRRQPSHVEQALQRAVQASMPAEMVMRFTSMAMSDERMSCSLDTLAAAIQRQVLDSTLPPWLRTASADDLSLYIGLLQRHYLNDDPGEALLPGLPSLQGFARELLINHLDSDYPHQVPDPDLITVTFTQYVPALVSAGETPSAIPAATIVNRESLTQFALNHFSNVEAAVLVVRFPDDLLIPAFIPPGYFKTLVRTLDAGRQYRDLLKARSAVNSQGYARGRSRFIAKIPARMLLLACEMKMQKQLSARAYGYLQNLLEMPDSIARQAFLGQQVTLRPLQLLAAVGMRPDPVLGVYLIGPMDESQGPIIVHALFNESFTFKEYAGKAELLLDLQTPGSLQTLVLKRVDPLLRRRYDHGGFREAHIPWSTEGYLDGATEAPGPTRLVGEPVSGNVLHYLFDETLSVLKDICRHQTVTSAEDDWNSLVNLMKLGAEQVLSFLPGHLGLLLAAWQSQTLFKASADSAYARRWGRALSEFTAALGQGAIRVYGGAGDVSDKPPPTGSRAACFSSDRTGAAD